METSRIFFLSRGFITAVFRDLRNEPDSSDTFTILRMSIALRWKLDLEKLVRTKQHVEFRFCTLPLPIKVEFNSLYSSLIITQITGMTMHFPYDALTHKKQRLLIALLKQHRMKSIHLDIHSFHLKYELSSYRGYKSYYFTQYRVVTHITFIICLLILCHLILWHVIYLASISTGPKFIFQSVLLHYGISSTDLVTSK